MRRASFLSLVAAASAATFLFTVSPANASSADDTTSLEVFSPDGKISRTNVTLPAEGAAPRAALAATEVVPIIQNGPSTNHLDIVVVGDGYTSSQFGTYGQHVKNQIDKIMAIEPFKSHTSRFNVWQVNVASPESGVDHDPTQGILKNTALDMGFWCNGNSSAERALCANVTKVKQYAAQAPDVDQILAIGNSTKYGGVGYPSSSVATASGGNSAAGDIAIHELGHTIGLLADEYDYAGNTCTSEPTAPNVSLLTSDQMVQQQKKWYSYMGKATPDGGVIGTYKGANASCANAYRPSENSVMRNLGRQFNLVGRDAMIAGFNREP